jgi:hypothetical protein
MKTRNPAMKTPTLLPAGRACASATALFLFLTATSGHSQRGVIIPAQSSSSLDESTSVVTAPTPNAPVAPLGSQIRDKSNVSQVTVPTSTPGKGNVSSVSERVATPATDTNVVAIQRVEVTPPPLDVATIKRLAELRDELGVAESAAKARINLPANDLFVAGKETKIEPLAEPALASVVEYLERTLKKNITVRSFFDPLEEGGKERAWARTLALIDWLKANSTLEPDHLKATSPEVLTKATPKAFSLNIGEVEFVNRIELHLE